MVKMEEILNKEIAQRIMKFEGKIRGMDLIADAEFILEKEGREALKRVEEKLKTIGFPIEYEKIKSMDFYPGGMKALSLLAIKEVLGYTDREIEEMGKAAPKISFIIKIFIKYFGPISKFFYAQTPKIWEKYWTVGKFIPVKLEEKEKWAIVRVEELDLHSIYCIYLKGYFSTVTKMVTGGQKITCQETKCPFKGNEFHEFLLKWQ